MKNNVALGEVKEKLSEGSVIKLSAQEYLVVWEKVNNPFYPNEMKWTRVTASNFARAYDELNNKIKKL